MKKNMEGSLIRREDQGRKSQEKGDPRDHHRAAAQSPSFPFIRVSFLGDPSSVHCAPPPIPSFLLFPFPSPWSSLPSPSFGGLTCGAPLSPPEPEPPKSGRAVEDSEDAKRELICLLRETAANPRHLATTTQQQLLLPLLPVQQQQQQPERARERESAAAAAAAPPPLLR